MRAKLGCDVVVGLAGISEGCCADGDWDAVVVGVNAG